MMAAWASLEDPATLACAIGLPTGGANRHICAAMPGESPEDFEKSRNAPGALYSVMGKSAQALDWDAPSLAKTI